MSKATITRLFVGSLIAIVGGCVLLLMAAILGAANGAFVMDGPEVAGIRSTGCGLSVGALAAIAILAIIGGGIGQFVAWIGAVLNTARLEDKAWFLVLLFLGVLSCGFIAMLAYSWLGLMARRPNSERLRHGQRGAPARRTRRTRWRSCAAATRPGRSTRRPTTACERSRRQPMRSARASA